MQPKSITNKYYSKFKNQSEKVVWIVPLTVGNTAWYLVE